jgi:hypothetical protein
MLSVVSACFVFALIAVVLYRVRFGGFAEVTFAVASLLIRWFSSLHHSQIDWVLKSAET